MSVATWENPSQGKILTFAVCYWVIPKFGNDVCCRLVRLVHLMCTSDHFGLL